MDIENAVCEYYNLPLERVLSFNRHSRKRDLECLHFIIYYQHYYNDMSIMKLSRRYNMTKRNVSYICAKIKWGVENQKYYHDTHRDIINIYGIKSKRAVI